MKIQSVRPQFAVPGGTVRIEVDGLKDPSSILAKVGQVRAEILGASSRAVTLRIPHGASDGLAIRNGDEVSTDLRIGRLVASDLHSVANPVVDALGNVFVTFSGPRGEQVPFSVFKVDETGDKQPFLADVVNPTGLAIGPDNCLYITSRHTGAVYRSTFDKQVDKYVDGLGLATGLVFDLEGNLLVGDRGGQIHKISPTREISVLCTLEPSVSAYHLAMGGDGMLYVTGPTLATQDSIYRISPDGRTEVFFKGLGRPQGIGFDLEGNLQVVASWHGQKGLYTVSDQGPQLSVAGPMLSGFAYSPQSHDLYLVDSTNLFRLAMG